VQMRHRLDALRADLDAGQGRVPLVVANDDVSVPSVGA